MAPLVYLGEVVLLDLANHFLDIVIQLFVTVHDGLLFVSVTLLYSKSIWLFVYWRNKVLDCLLTFNHIVELLYSQLPAFSFIFINSISHLLVVTRIDVSLFAAGFRLDDIMCLLDLLVANIYFVDCVD